MDGAWCGDLRASCDRPRGNAEWGSGLASETDFLDMYRTLGLRPGCALPDLKQAYRRHVSRLHPDRKGGVTTDPAATASLQRLIAQYDAAMAFQREHGRLPGVTPRVRFSVPEAHVPPARMRVARRPAWRHPALALLLPAVAIILLGWDIASRPSVPAESSTPAVATEKGDMLASSDKAPTLTLGMSPSDVRAIEGVPVSIHGDRWEYGPSWVLFEDGRVVDWYNSPLRSLGEVPRTADTPPNLPPASNN